MKIALVHDWLVSIAGGEKVLEAIYEIFPSPIYTLVKDEVKLQRASFAKAKITPSLIQNLPFAKRSYRNYLPLFPFAIEQFDLSTYDVVLSTSHCAAKGVLTHSDQIHICYCFTPLRYGWDLYHQYIEEAGLKKGVKGFFAKFFIHYLRIWDSLASQRVDAFLAISHYVKRRIKKTYGRDSEVIYPPVDVDFFELSEKKEDFYLTASRMVPYKKIDLIVEAFAAMPEKRLLVIGDGPEKEKIKAKAKKNITFLGSITDQEMKNYMQRAKAFVFAAIEDFGIVPIEAMATGTPVIALGKGGSLETIKEGVSGLFFPEQTVSSLQEAMMKFEKVQDNFHPKKVRESVLSFNKDRFQKEIKTFVEETACKLSY